MWSKQAKPSWRDSSAPAGIVQPCLPHGLRRTFDDLMRRAGVDAIVTRSITGHVTERMQEHYGSVAIDENRTLVARVLQLVRGVEDAEVGTPPWMRGPPGWTEEIHQKPAGGSLPAPSRNEEQALLRRKPSQTGTPVTGHTVTPTAFPGTRI